MTTEVLIVGDAGRATRNLLQHTGVTLFWALTGDEARAVLHSTRVQTVVCRADLVPELVDRGLALPSVIVVEEGRTADPVALERLVARQVVVASDRAALLAGLELACGVTLAAQRRVSFSEVLSRRDRRTSPSATRV